MIRAATGAEKTERFPLLPDFSASSEDVKLPTTAALQPFCVTGTQTRSRANFEVRSSVPLVNSSAGVINLQTKSEKYLSMSAVNY